MKKYSISQKLFRAYVSCFVLCFAVLLFCSIFYIRFMGRNIEKTREQLMVSMDENIQNYFEEMNEFSRELMNSVKFKQAVMLGLPEAFENGKGTAVLFSDIYGEAYKMIQKKYQVGVAVQPGYYIWMGNRYYIAKVNPEEISMYDGLTRDETPHILFFEQSEYLQAAGSEENVPRVVLARSMDRSSRRLNGRAILEVQVTQEEFSNTIRGAWEESGTGGVHVNIFDMNGKEIYAESEHDLTEFLEMPPDQKYKKEGELVYVHRVFDGKIPVIYSVERSVYNRRLYTYLAGALAITAAVLLVMSVITIRISRQISRPLSEMCRNVREIKVETGENYREVTTDIHEIQFLSDTLYKMNRRLEDSMQRIIAMKDYEIHAKMLALQAQMQPHFLFNTLTTISSIAEEEGNDRIDRMCGNLTKMFRYISADAPQGVRMFEEISHIEHYVEIMKERFPNAVIRMEIPLEIWNVRIPKLSIQPLVENSFKYCNREKPEITVRGNFTEDGRWTVEVLDNGRGFSEEKREEIFNKCREALQNEETFSAQIDGMGLVNVYVRMRLFYGEQMVYEIGNDSGRILIGGQKD